MKSLHRMAQAFLENLPGFTETDLVTHIMDRGHPIRLEEPKRADELVCPICGDSSGYRVIDGGNVWWACRKPDCIRINGKKVNQEKKHMIEAIADVPKIYEMANFRDYKHSEKYIYKARDWFFGSKQNLLIAGTNGSGKTYTSICIIRAETKLPHPSYRFCNVSDLYSIWLAEKGGAEFTKTLEKMVAPRLLILDDLGIRTPTDSFLDIIYQIVNRRYNDGKKTVITTNFLRKEELTKALGTAISSRLLSGDVIKMEGKDYRQP